MFVPHPDPQPNHCWHTMLGLSVLWMYMYHGQLSPSTRKSSKKCNMKVAKSSRSGIEIYNGEVALLQIGVMITSLEVALSQKYLHIFLCKSICVK